MSIDKNKTEEITDSEACNHETSDPEQSMIDQSTPDQSATEQSKIEQPESGQTVDDSADLSEGSNNSGKPKRRKWGRIILLMFLVLLFFVALSAVREILLPFVLAIVLSYILSPVVGWISEKKIKGRSIPRWISVIMIYLALGFSIYIFSIAIVPRFVHEFGKLAQDTPGFFRKASQVWIPRMNIKLQSVIDQFTAPMAEYEKAKDGGLAPVVESDEFELEIIPGGTGVTTIEGINTGDDGLLTENNIDAFLARIEDYSIDVDNYDKNKYRVNLIPKQSFNEKDKNGSGISLDFSLEKYLKRLLSSGQKVIADGITLGRSVVSIVVSSLMTLVLTLMLSAFILMDTPRIMRFFRSMVPPRYRSEYDELLSGVNRGLGGVIRGQLMICLVNGTLTGIGLLILGVKYAVTLAMIAAVFSLIPIFGTIISSVPSIGIALTQSLWLGVAVLIWITIIHLIEANILNPKIIGTSAHIHPVLVVLALVAGEHAYGLMGALLAVPVFSIFQTLFLYFRQKAYSE